ncbi:hypothetical protein Tsubulata_008164 [Turnera subulata]|uniref:Serine aminopeptidase S33 domain-containing protein n=1 Tax=Turnera subulata TaxID=218843 RepID=A0A9Q0GJR0_9ROSI|nr:hypothetical protein Tsubulata_008164 [Turnera subulata]
MEGHGRSQGLKGYVPNIDLVVQDCLSFFTSVKQDPNYNGLPSFLYGESMGGAMCLLVHLASPGNGFFDGAVLVAPMCKISDDMRPRWPIPEVLAAVARFLPTLAIVPTVDILPKAIKVEEKQAIALANPMRYTGKPRLRTVTELLRVTDYLGKRALYEEASSQDKTLKIYDGMMHSLLFGETDENIEMVRRDILSWLNDRCNSDSKSSSLS